VPLSLLFILVKLLLVVLEIVFASGVAIRWPIHLALRNLNFPYQLQNFVVGFKNYVRKHWWIITLLHEAILRQRGQLNGWWTWLSDVCESVNFKKAILETRIYIYHGQLWSIGLVDKFPLCRFHHIFYVWSWTPPTNFNLTRCNDNN
jgi:hypothetical protein